MVARHIAGLEMHLGGAVVIARDETVEDLGEEAPLLRAESAHDAEVDRGELTVMVDKQIAGVHVGMKETVAQRVAQERLDYGGSERLEIEAFGFQPRTIIERYAVDPLERENVARGAVPVDGR